MQRAHRTARRFGRGGIDQINHAFGLRQIKLVVEISAPGELPWLSNACAQLQATPQQELEDHRPAMALKLQHVLSGVGMRRWKIKRQALVYGCALVVAEISERRAARLQRPTDDLCDEGS